MKCSILKERKEHIYISHLMTDSGYIGNDLGNLCLINKMQPFGKIRSAALHSEHYKYRS